MNYIGSKLSLLEHIKDILRKHQVPLDGIALDLFTGTSIVAQLFKSLGYQTYANDWQYYAYLLSFAYISLNKSPDKSKLNYLNKLPGKSGPFYEAYAEGGKAKRLYFSKQNGLKIQAIRDQIFTWQVNKEISLEENNWLIACLLQASDKVANTASVYGAHLKHLKKPAQKDLILKAITPISSTWPKSKHKTFCTESVSLVQSLKNVPLITYIDPPYNHRQYSANYHILETIAFWDLDKFTPRGVTGLRSDTNQQSPYCLKTQAYPAFDKLFSYIKSPYLLFSYNNEGILSEKQLSDLFNKYFIKIDFQKINYQRFRADQDKINRKYKAEKTQEFLILCSR
ncbi:DNA adenine methylase [Candidatus Margulisiibacteriota bacterium]